MIPLARGQHEFLDRWAAICRQGQRDLNEWRSMLRANGVKAAHPDDGWVDRDALTVFFCYPHFDDGVRIGDTIALGWDWQWRLVSVVGKIEGFQARWKYLPLPGTEHKRPFGDSQ